MQLYGIEIFKIVYVPALLIGLMASRLSLVGSQRGLYQYNIGTSLIGVLASALTLTMLVWGFASLPWYWPVGTFLLGSWLANLVITNKNFHVWYAFSPLPDILVIVGGLHFWMWYWPF